MSDQKPTVAVPRKDGKWSIDENKIRVTYTLGADSVLFEDISSISFKSRAESVTSVRTIILSFLGTGSCAGTAHDDSLGAAALLFLLIPLISFFADGSIFWDDVEIETRGGKIIRYSTDQGNGASEIDRIEAAKRDWESRVK